MSCKRFGPDSFLLTGILFGWGFLCVLFLCPVQTALAACFQAVFSLLSFLLSLRVGWEVRGGILCS